LGVWKGFGTPYNEMSGVEWMNGRWTTQETIFGIVHITRKIQTQSKDYFKASRSVPTVVRSFVMGVGILELLLHPIPGIPRRLP